MTATAHAAIGVALAALIPNPVIGLPVAFASHIVCDLVPHWDAGTHMQKKSKIRLTLESTGDVLGSVFLTCFLLLVFFPQVNFLYGISMAFTAQLLDWLSAPYFFLDMKFIPFTWVADFQKMINIRLDKPWGIVTQSAVTCLLLITAKII